MRTFSFVQVLLLLVFLLAYQCTQAQDYVLTTRGDSINGKIKLYNYGPDKKVQITPEGKKKQMVPLLQVSTMVFEGETYKPQKGPEGYAFMKLMKDGYLSLFGFQQENRIAFDGLLLVKKDGRTMEVPNLNFKKALRRFLEDCPEVSENIEGGEYTKKDLNTIIDDYNRCMDSNTTVPTSQTPIAEVPQKKSDALGVLEEKVKTLEDFSGKSDALDMIAEIKNKLSRSEKVPNFLTEGLKQALKDTSVENELEAVLKEVR